MAVLTSSYHYNIIKKYLCAKYRRQSVVGYFMKKRIATIVTTFVLASALSLSAAAAMSVEATITYRDIKIVLNEQKIEPKDATGNVVEPFIMNGTTYLPVRSVASALGLDVQWDNKTATVSLSVPEEKKDVYITKTGKKYHNDDTCNGGTYWPVPLSTALGMNLQPCDKCVY